MEDRVHRGPRRLFILDIKNKKDHINILLHYLEHSFSHVYACMNARAYAKHFNMEGLFTKYTLNQYWTAGKLTTLALNISKYNIVVIKANQKTKSKKTICIRDMRFHKFTQASAFHEQVDEGAQQTVHTIQKVERRHEEVWNERGH